MINFIGMPRSKARFESVKNVCVECVNTLHKEYGTPARIYTDKRKGFCECCETNNKFIVEVF